MRPLRYHAGQIEVQEEAQSRELADRMAGWVGPAAEFAERADLLLFAAPEASGLLTFTLISGPAPLVEVAPDGAIRIIAADASRFREGSHGGLAINLGEARRVRLNGRIQVTSDSVSLDVDEAFTLCRKYLARSVSRGDRVHVGPEATEPLMFDDAWLHEAVASADTSFLASIAPDGAPDVAHRGGPPGFLTLDSAARTLSWPEYIGDGVFKSAGNVRATGRITLLVPHFASGDAVAISGRAAYTNERVLRSERRAPLEQHDRAHPVQGMMRCEVDSVVRLRAAIKPREAVAAAVRVSSASSTNEQAPQ